MANPGSLAANGLQTKTVSCLVCVEVSSPPLVGWPFAVFKRFISMTSGHLYLACFFLSGRVLARFALEVSVYRSIQTYFSWVVRVVAV
jgi:hypothetical protein